MQRPPDRQRVINIASGYCFACWVSVTLAWVLLAVGSWAAMLFGMMAAAAVLFGLPRCIQTRRAKFVWLLMATLGYLGIAVVFAVLSDDAWLLTIMCGLVYSCAAGVVVLSILRHDYAKPVPVWVCGSCGYTLLGLRDGVCPECGEGFDIERVPEIAPQSTHMPRD